MLLQLSLHRVSAAFSDHFATHHHHPNCSNSGFQRHFWLNQWHTCCLVCSMSNSCRTLAFCTWKSHNTANTGKYGDGRLINSLDYYIYICFCTLWSIHSHMFADRHLLHVFYCCSFAHVQSHPLKSSVCQPCTCITLPLSFVACLLSLLSAACLFTAFAYLCSSRRTPWFRRVQEELWNLAAY